MVKRRRRKQRRAKLDTTELQLEALRVAAEVYRKERERQKRIEWAIITGIGALISFIVFSIWYTNGQVATDAIRFISQYDGKDAVPSPSVVTNCSMAKNKDTAYCQNRVLHQASTWREITRFGGDANAFPLYGKDK